MCKPLENPEGREEVDAVMGRNVIMESNVPSDTVKMSMSGSSLLVEMDQKECKELI